MLSFDWIKTTKSVFFCIDNEKCDVIKTMIWINDNWYPYLTCYLSQDVICYRLTGIKMMEYVFVCGDRKKVWIYSLIFCEFSTFVFYSLKKKKKKQTKTKQKQTSLSFSDMIKICKTCIYFTYLTIHVHSSDFFQNIFLIFFFHAL